MSSPSARTSLATDAPQPRDAGSSLPAAPAASSSARSSSAKDLRIRRRTVLGGALAAGVGYWLGTGSGAVRADSPNEKLNLAIIGAGGRGAANLSGVSSQNIVALCDVDEKRAGKAFEQYRQAARFHDFRKMYDQLSGRIDGVVISTPDHTHFHPAMMAMELGKHVYCEKPMAHSVAEVRAMTEMARRQKVATQLGVQRHTLANVHRVVELVKSGAIGSVTEVHSWVGGSRGMPAVPSDTPPVPEHLQWDLWLGPAAERPYHSAYAPYGWRFWWDFGTGETGNWGCHILDIPYWALDLKYPTRVEGSGPPVHPQTTPTSMTTRFEFPARADQPAVTLHWYHAKNGPEILRERKLPNTGNTLFIGTEGMLLCDFGRRKLYPEDKFADFQAPEPFVPNSPGFYKEWLDACKGGPAATCHFDYSGPLTETVLLGNAAYRVQGGFDWDAGSLRASGNDGVQPYLESRYRPGWEI